MTFSQQTSTIRIKLISVNHSVESSIKMLLFWGTSDGTLNTIHLNPLFVVCISKLTNTVSTFVLRHPSADSPLISTSANCEKNLL